MSQFSLRGYVSDECIYLHFILNNLFSFHVFIQLHYFNLKCNTFYFNHDWSTFYFPLSKASICCQPVHITVAYYYYY